MGNTFPGRVFLGCIRKLAENGPDMQPVGLFSCFYFMFLLEFYLDLPRNEPTNKNKSFLSLRCFWSVFYHRGFLKFLCASLSGDPDLARLLRWGVPRRDLVMHWSLVITLLSEFSAPLSSVLGVVPSWRWP